MITFKDINGNEVTINIRYVVAIYCDSEVILSTGDRIKIDMPYDQLRATINMALPMNK